MAPNEWLLELNQNRDGHRRLLAEEGGNLSVAAWRLARARCASGANATDIPSAIELRGAAREIAKRSGLGAEVPDARGLARECERLGYLVI